MLSRQVKEQVFTEITSTPFLGKYEEYDGILTFLNKIWDLKEMPSTDQRFKNAYEDTLQHIVNNNDWTIEYLFIERLNLLDGEEKYFILFIEGIVNPTVRKSKDEILRYVSKINPLIQSSGFRLILTDYFEELPVYKFKDGAEVTDLPLDILPNIIPIYLKGEERSIQYPQFTLDYDYWDDYGLKTTMILIYHQNEKTFRSCGRVKIMMRGSKSTWEALPKKFVSLSSDYCSLGQDKEYYFQLKEFLGGEYYSFLLALRDVAIFPKIHEQFENDPIYKASLIRGNEVERLARTIRFEIEGVKPNEYYKFNYTHKPPYAENTIPLNFDFEYNTNFEHRIYALIGKNGTGKTRILSSLAKNLSEKDPSNFTPRKPVYGKVFTVSYSFFDSFEIPQSSASFNYVYCGLKKKDGTWKDQKDLLLDFFQAAELIREKNLENDWYEILSNFIEKDFLDIAFARKENGVDPFGYEFKANEFTKIRKVLSSGQSIILFMLSEILSKIRFDSLILFDEPETHLHPNAISALLNTLFSLVGRFQSFCVLATHSPLILQEIPSRNIFVIERDGNNASVRSLERESFGENLTVITQDIFGNSEVPRHFMALIQDLISQKKTYDEIISILESDNLPVASNVKLYIKAYQETQ
jgi:predicted ATPase